MIDGIIFVFADVLFSLFWGVSSIGLLLTLWAGVSNVIMNNNGITDLYADIIVFTKDVFRCAFFFLDGDCISCK